jgi:CIC family chloride channel protein
MLHFAYFGLRHYNMLLPTDWQAKLRHRLAFPLTSVQLCLLAIVAGLAAALLILLFRLTIIGIQSFFLERTDDFSSLAESYRWALPFIAAICICLMAMLVGLAHYRMGIAYVIHRIKTQYGVIPFWNTFNQFFGGIIALSSGFSVGREGPSVHLGAFGAGMLGYYLHLPYNSIRILAGCGIAAAISASFNTPLAAVIFVMEVVLREYRIHVFVPVMLASVVGALLTRGVFGMANDLAALKIVSISGWHLPYLVLCGIAIGAGAYLFNQSIWRILKWTQQWHLAPKLLLAAAITAAIGHLVPQALGAETGAIFYSVTASTEFWLLLTILLAKFVLTVVAVALAVPGGVVGPVFGIGILAGTLLAFLPVLVSGDGSLSGTYATLGMAGFMAATLHAPLAALVAVMELSYNPDIIVPAMLVITCAYVTTVQLFKNKSIFVLQLELQQLPYKLAPADDVLQKVGVLAMLDKEYLLLQQSDEEKIESLLANKAAHQLVLQKTADPTQPYLLIDYDLDASMTGEATLVRQPLQGLTQQASMAEVHSLLDEQKGGVVYIFDSQKPEHLLGLIRWEQVRALLTKQNNLI